MTFPAGYRGVFPFQQKTGLGMIKGALGGLPSNDRYALARVFGMAPHAVRVASLTIRHGGMKAMAPIQAGTYFRVAIQAFEAPAAQSQFMARLALGKVIEFGVSG